MVFMVQEQMADGDISYQEIQVLVMYLAPDIQHIGLQ